MFKIHSSGLIAFIAFLFCIPSGIYSQADGQILIVSNVEAKVVIDGDEIGVVKPNIPTKFSVLAGEHYLQVTSPANSEERNEILTIEAGKQKVLKFDFGGLSTSKERISVADLNISIPGLVTVGAVEGFEYPYHLYAFEKGDEMFVDLEMSNAKGTNEIEIFSYPDLNTIYSNGSFQDLKNLRIPIKERSIYGITFRSNHAFDRDARLKVERKPQTEATKEFNTKVSWKETHTVQQVHKPQEHYVNSGSHATFQGGKSRVLIPLNLPENTVKWYYSFSAFREDSKVEEVTGLLNLATELSSLIDETGLIEFGINQLTQPPGSDYCDLYILDHTNSSLFTQKKEYSYTTEGSRTNLSAGIVEVQGSATDLIYIGIKNPSNFHGIHVVIEVAAVVKQEGWRMGEN